MIIIGAIIAILFGAILGSFLNVLIVRIHDATSLWGRSRCVHCERTIRPRHLVPIFSWIWLQGKCADCHKSIHFQYPFVEIFAAALSFIAFIRHDFFFLSQLPLFLFELFFCLNLLFLAVFDWRWKLLPVEWMTGSIVIFGLASYTLGFHSFPSLILSALIAFVFLGAQVLLSKGKWLGSGDPILGALVGIVLGWSQMIIAFYFTYLIGAVLAIVLLALKKVSSKTRVAFGPLLATGALLALWFGSTIEAWWRAIV